ncbi:MAG: transposase [Arsenophonus sp. NC-PE1-MAG3]
MTLLHEHKELVALSNAYRESESSWTKFLNDLRARGLNCISRFVRMDGAICFGIIVMIFPDIQYQRY